MSNKIIKIRAWDKSTNKMILDYVSCSYEKTTQHIPMINTRLKDSKGVEIFEGDIVYLAGLGDTEIEFPFDELYESYPEGDIGKIVGHIYDGEKRIEE